MEDSNWKHVYVMLASDGRVKIGIGKDVDKQILEIQNTEEVKILKVYKTELCSNPYTIERMCHDFFKDRRSFGVWFNISYDDAVSALKDFFKKNAELGENKTNVDLMEYLKSSHINDDDSEIDVVRILVEIVLQQENRIEVLMENINELSKANTEIAEMYKELVFFMNKSGGCITC